MSQSTIERITLTAKLPSGREVTVQELSGDEELAVASELGDASGSRMRMMAVRSTVLRSLKKLDGKAFDASEHTPDSLRGAFSQKDWQALTLAVTRLTGMSEEENELFEKSFRFSAA